MENTRVHLFIYGDVIGVGFRYWTVGEARKLGLTGWVRNLENSVEAVIEGPKKKVEKMVGLCKEGPPVSSVKQVDIKWEEYSGSFDELSITG